MLEKLEKFRLENPKVIYGGSGLTGIQRIELIG